MLNYHIISPRFKLSHLKKVLINVSQDSRENTCVGVYFIKKNFIKKEIPTQVFSCEFCKIFKYIFFRRTLPVAASVNYT